MARLNPKKLSVEFRHGVTTTEPIICRRYTLTHSDVTGELFLTIGLAYAYDKVTSMRDEVLAEWCKINNEYLLNVYLDVDGEFDIGNAAIRNGVFRRELPLALEAIRYGDREFFNAHPKLNSCPIIVYFNSSIPEYNRVEKWGSPSHYKYVYKQREEKSKTTILSIEDKVIVTLLNPYIENEILRLYGNNEQFCLNEVEILAIEQNTTENICISDYNIAVGLKVGINATPYNNLIIEFNVNPSSVITKSVKNPR